MNASDRVRNCFDVVIVGGGFAGISVAARLRRRRPGLSIAVVEPSDRHYYQPAWTLVGGGAYDIARTCRDQASMIPSGVEWIRAAPTSKTAVGAACSAPSVLVVEEVLPTTSVLGLAHPRPRLSGNA